MLTMTSSDVKFQDQRSFARSGPSPELTWPLRARTPSECSDIATISESSRKATVSITTLSSRDFNQDTSNAKKAARRGPVIITDRGRPAHVLLSIEQYQALTAPASSIVDLLAMPGTERVRFNPPRLRTLTRTADLG